MIEMIPFNKTIGNLSVELFKTTGCYSLLGDVDFACFVREQCQNAFHHNEKLLILMVFLPVLVNFLLFLGKIYHKKVGFHQKKQVFEYIHWKSFRRNITFEVGFSNLQEYREFIYRETILFVALVSGVMLYLSGFFVPYFTKLLGH